MSKPAETAGNNTAKSHTNFTNRENRKSAPKKPTKVERRVVFKSVLHNPLQVQWPAIPTSTQTTLLGATCEFLQSIGPYHVSRRRQSTANQKKKRKERLTKATTTTESLPMEDLEGNGDANAGKRKRDEEAGSEGEHDEGHIRSRKKQKPSTGAEDDSRAALEQTEAGILPDDDKDCMAAPALLGYLTIGINEVTRRIEAQTLSLRTGALHGPIPSSPATPEAQPPEAEEFPPHLFSSSEVPSKRLRLVLACRSDVDPPLLIAHLPLLVASYNSLLPPELLKTSAIVLATLPKRAEHALAEALGLRRAALLGFDADTPDLSRLLDHVGQGLEPLTALWLGNPQSVEFVPTHVKQLKTTAPKDMKHAKEERATGRAAAKARRRAKKGVVVRTDSDLHKTVSGTKSNSSSKP